MTSGPVPTPPTDSHGAALRIGIMIDGMQQPAWVHDVLRQLVLSDFAHLTVVVINKSVEAQAAPPGPVERVGRWLRNRHLLPYALYQRFDNARYRPEIDPEAPTALEPLIRGVETIVATPRMTKHCDYLEPAAIAALRKLDLDVMLRFGFRILKGDVLTCARNGVWSFHHGDNTVKRGGPAAFWEVWEGESATGAVLQRLSEQLDGGLVLARSFAATQLISVRRNRANSLAQAAQLLLPALRQLHEEGPASRAPTVPLDPQWHAYDQRLYVAPRPHEVARLFGRITGRLIRNKLLLWLTREQWIVAFRFSPGTSPSNQAPDGTLHKFTELVPPKDRFWADPFPVYQDGRYFLFYEQLVYARGVGEIWVMELAPGRAPHGHRVALQRSYHLSYPHVFRWRDEWYMVPETFEMRRIELYRATRFPEEWDYVGPVLEDVAAVDPTIVEVAGVWWLMFATVLPGTEDASALHLYYASSPLGPWTAHRRNPVKVDARGARPAGRVFEQGERLYRPAQDGTPRYGTAIRVFEITTLTEDAYEEHQVAHIAPRWRKGLVGMHTINAAGSLTTVDVRQRRMRWR